MKSLALILGLLVAFQALPAKGSTPLPVIEGAPVPIQPKILGGDTAKSGQFAYQAAIPIDSSTFCGGSLIARDWVLTAAQCAKGTTFEVILGRLQWEGSGGGVDIKTTEKFVHINYNNGTQENNIALLRLPEKVPLSNNIQLVRLATEADTANNFIGETAQVSGWGSTTQGGANSQELMFLDLPIIANDACADGMLTTTIVSSTICARGPAGKSPCTGDIGGPLVIYRKGVGHIQVGIVSFMSSNGCAADAPAAYTRVTSFRDWIKQTSGV